MDNDTLRVVLAAAVGPLLWAPVHWLVQRHRRKHAARDAFRRELKLKRAYRFGQRIAHWLR